MKKLNIKQRAISILIVLMWINYVYAQDKNGGDYIPYEIEGDYLDRPEDIKWWRSDKFGLFIHWGPYSVAEGYCHMIIPLKVAFPVIQVKFIQ